MNLAPTRHLVSASVVCLLACTAGAAAPFYRIIEIPLPPGVTKVTPYGISDAGQVVGVAYGSGIPRGFSFMNGVTTLLATPAGSTATLAVAVNAPGQIVGWNYIMGFYKSAIWQSATDSNPEILESGGGPNANVYVAGINDAGVICGHYSFTGSGDVSNARAVKWEVDSQGHLRQQVLMTGVSPLPPRVYHAAHGINNIGQVVGTGAWIDPDLPTGQAPIRWSHDEIPMLLELFLDEGSEQSFSALAINDASVSVGWARSNIGPPRALRWAADGSVTDLGTLAGGGNGYAIDINNTGLILGVMGGPVIAIPAVHDGAGWVALNARLLHEPGWSTIAVEGLNDAGWIVGEADSHLVRGVVLVPIDDIAAFAACFSGPGAAPAPAPPQTASVCLQLFDLNEDGDIDLEDFAGIQNALANP